MARTAPVPNIPPIPGMNPGTWLMGGGGDGGKGSGKGGKGGSGKEGAGTEKGEGDGKGGGSNADGCGQGSGGGCPNPSHGGAGTAAGDPVDFTTGRVYTIAAPDLVLPGPLTFVIERTYDSTLRDRDIGLGHGWTHSLAWQLRLGRRRLELTTGSGINWDLPLPEVGAFTQIQDLRVQRDRQSVSVTAGSSGLTYYFEPVQPIGGTSRPAPEPQLGVYLLKAVMDAYGNGLRLSYENEHLIGLIDSAGRLVRVRRNGRRIAAFEVSNGNGGWVAYRSYDYDAAGDLVAARDGYGQPVRYAYTADHSLSSQTLPEGMTTFYRYDQRGRCFETWCEWPNGDPALDADVPSTLADGVTRARGALHCKIDYADDYVEVVTSRSLRRYFVNNGVVERAIFGGGVHEHRYNALGYLTEYVNAANSAWRWTYDAGGRKTSETGPLGDVVTWSYDRRGRLERIDYPGTFLEYQRNDQGDLLSALDALGMVVAYERNEAGQIVRAQTPAGATVMGYDAMGNRVLVREPNGGERRISYDALGQVVAMIDENGHETRYLYGAGRELQAVLMPDGSRVEYGYDRDGHLTRIRTPLGNYELAWGAYDVVHEVKTPDGGSVRFRYDRECGLVRVINAAGDEHVLTRDAEGRVVSERTFDGRRYDLSVDALGRVTRVTSDSGEITDVVYDALGRIVERTLPDGVQEKFTYDWFGRVTSCDNGSVRCTFSYDARGRCVRETQAYAGAVESVDSTFGGTARLQLQTSRGHDQRSTLTPMGFTHELMLPGAPAPLRFGFDGADNEIERVLPGGAVIHAAFDGLARLVRRSLYAPQQAPGGGPEQPDWVGQRPGLLLEQALEYLPGTRLPVRQHDSRLQTIELAHDALGQIRSRLPQHLPPETFAYVAQERVIDNGVARDYQAGGRLVRRGSTEYVYDAEHRLVEKRVQLSDTESSLWRYEWNGAGLLAAVTRPDGVRVEYVYDTFARRVEKRTLAADQEPIASVRYVWDGDNLIHEVRRRPRSNGDPIVEQRTYAFMNRSRAPVAHRDTTFNGKRVDASWVYYLNDETGRAQALLDDRGDLLASFDEKAFGRVEALGHARASTSARFMGHWEDDETGLFYNRYRYYDPETARYLSPEPMGLEGGLSVFGYARNRPFDYVDPDGLAGMVATGAGTPPRGSAGTEGIPSAAVLAAPPGPGGGLHPVVAGALANPSLATSYGSPRSPAACAEPRHLSDYLYNHQPPVDPNDPASVRGALQNYNVQACQANNANPRAPCPNCSQMFANLMSKYGAPDPNNIGAGGTAWNSLPANHTNFTPPPPGAAGNNPTGKAFPSYAAAMAHFNATNCLPGDALIATPLGDVPVRELEVGSYVYTLHAGRRVARPLLGTCRVPVSRSHVVRHLALDDGRRLWVSPGHPTETGALAADLCLGDDHDGARIVAADDVPYRDSETFDVLPDGDSGCYWANGVLLGSTLFESEATGHAKRGPRGTHGKQEGELRAD